MTEPLRDALAAALADTYWTSARPYPSWADAIIAALAQQGVTLTREPGRPDWVGVPDANGDIHCSRLAPQRCMWLEGHYGGCATP